MKRAFLFAVVSVISLTIAPSLQAEQWTEISPTGKPQVMHNRMAPVIVHRVFPPYTGIHQYARGRNAAR
jgi:hypothetical protein